MGGRVYSIPLVELSPWSPWFAWRPVKLVDGKRAWFSWIERRQMWMVIPFCEYREAMLHAATESGEVSDGK